MKFFALRMRLIAPLVVLCCFVCFCCMAPAAFSQVPRGTTVSIGSASQSGSNTTYFYNPTLTTGTATDVKVGASIVITGMTGLGAADNGTFTITAVSPAPSFTVVNAGGAAAGGQMGTGTVVLFSPESGALLEIDGTVGSTPTGHIKVYDSQIETMNVVTVTAAAATNASNCNAADLIPSAAYLHQAAAPTGCDEGDVAESGLTFVGNTSTPNKGSFTFGPPNFTAPFPPFTINSEYICLRNNTSVNISAVSQNASTSTTTYTYTFTLTSGPALQVGEAVIISGLNPPGNNSAPDPTSAGAFIITGLQNGTFNVFNPNGSQQFDQSGTAVSACGATPLTVSNAATNGGTTTFTYATVGPALTTSLLPTGETVKLTGFTGAFASDNKQFPITNLQNGVGGTTFDVAGGSGTGTVTTTATITATNNMSGTTTYTYDPASLIGPGFAATENVTIKCFTSTLVGNNGTFANLANLTPTTFSVVNPAGVTLNATTNQTKIFNITSVVNNGNGTTTYTYASGIGGPALQTPPLPPGCPLESMTITGLTPPMGENGTFTIQNQGVGTVTLNNANGKTTTVNISGAMVIDATTMRYAFTPVANSTSPLVNGQSVSISGFANTMTDPMGANDNGTFTISNVTATTFDVANGQVISGVTTTGTQNATGMVNQSGSANGTATQVGLATAMPSGTAAMSNTKGTVFSNDTGFLSVMNTSTSAFTGTIKLSGQAGNSTKCPPPESSSFLSDTVSNGLAAGASAVLALSNDSSGCGGYNAPQTQTLVAGTTNIFPFGNDAYQITAFDSKSGDMLTVQLVTVPAGPLNASGQYPATIPPGPCSPSPCPQETPISSPLRFSATNFPSQACIAYKDLSAALNPVCAEFQVSCFNPSSTLPGGTCSDALTYLYISELDYAKAPNSLNLIGGNAYLGEHSGSPLGYNGQCPTTGFNLNVFLAYTPTAPDWTKGGGTGSNCYVGTFDPTAAGVPVGQTLRQEFLVGFQNPVVNCTGIFPAACGPTNLINRGRSWPLTWRTFSDPTSTVPVTNLTFCPNFNGSGCPTAPNPPDSPWVFVGTLAVDCMTSVPVPGAMVAVAQGSSSFRNLGAIEPQQFPPGTYQLNLDTTNVTASAGGCFTPVLGFSFGFYSFNQAVAQFKQ